jgi:hypothetical protein
MNIEDLSSMSAIKMTMSFMGGFKDSNFPESPEYLGISNDMKQQMYYFITQAKLNDRIRGLIQARIHNKIVDF